MATFFPNFDSLVLKSSQVLIEKNAFKGLHKLKYLEISKSNLSLEEDNSFEYLIGLKSLNLTESHIDTNR